MLETSLPERGTFQDEFKSGVWLSADNESLLGRLSELKTAVTLDELTLEDKPSMYAPNDVNLRSWITKNISLKSFGILSAAMDTVTEVEMALEIAKLGGVGIIHRNMSVQEQTRMVSWVRQKINYGGMVEHPVTFLPDQYFSDVEYAQQKFHYQFTSFPIVSEDRVLLGLVTHYEIDFIEEENPQLGKIMKPIEHVITAPSNTTSLEAYTIMSREKVKKLPIIDSSGKLVGMYAWDDVKKDAEKRELFSLDSEGHFLVGAAIGFDAEDFERAKALAEVGCKLFVLDSSHGASISCLEQLERLRVYFGNSIDIIIGNVASYESAKFLLNSKYLPDAIKVGIGPGSICTTRDVTGHGVPQITAIHQVVKAVRESGNYMPVIADGGLRSSGDIVKVIAAGASGIMLGSMLAGTREAPGKVLIKDGKEYKLIRGMGSRSAMEERSGSRMRYYRQSNVNSSETITKKQQQKITPEGIEGLIEFKGPLVKVLSNILGGIKSGLAHSGANSIKAFQEKATFWLQSMAGTLEGHPHNVQHITY